jgi:hypothetical protein
MEHLATIAGLFGLIGFAGLWGIRNPVEKERSGGTVRVLGLLGLAGLAGFWIPGAGAVGAAGALGLWNHQNPKLAFWGRLGWLWLAGVPFLAGHFLA